MKAAIIYLKYYDHPNDNKPVLVCKETDAVKICLEMNDARINKFDLRYEAIMGIETRFEMSGNRERFAL
jgi:hypothetical protein